MIDIYHWFLSSLLARTEVTTLQVFVIAKLTSTTMLTWSTTLMSTTLLCLSSLTPNMTPSIARTRRGWTLASHQLRRLMVFITPTGKNALRYCVTWWKKETVSLLTRKTRLLTRKRNKSSGLSGWIYSFFKHCADFHYSGVFILMWYLTYISSIAKAYSTKSRSSKLVLLQAFHFWCGIWPSSVFCQYSALPYHSE